MAKTITVSFKEKEAYLYDYLVGKSSSPATYLKDLALVDYKKSTGSSTPSKPVVNVPSFDFLD